MKRTPIFPAPFPRKGVTMVQPLTRFPVIGLPPYWGGPVEAA